MRINELLWDSWNKDHIARRGITGFDVEAVLKGSVSRVRIERARDSTLAIWGRSESGKYLLIILSPRDKGSYYPVTARIMEDREKRRYIKWLK